MSDVEVLFLSCFKYFRARQNNEILIFKWRSFVSVHDPIIRLSYEPQDPICRSCQHILPCICMQMQMETHLEFTPRFRQSLLSHRGKPPELTHRHTTLHPTLSVFQVASKEKVSRVHPPCASPTREAAGRIGSEATEVSFLWALDSGHHQQSWENWAPPEQASHLSEEPASRAATIMHFKARYIKVNVGYSSPRKASSNLQQQETGSIPLPTAPPVHHSPNAAHPPAVIPRAAPHPTAAAGKDSPAETHVCLPQTWGNAGLNSEAQAFNLPPESLCYC